MNETERMDLILGLLQDEVSSLKTPAVGLIAERTEDPFCILIACVLSLRTRDDVTAAASARLFKIASRPLEMSTLSAGELELAIYPVSFYRNKAKSILGICKEVLGSFSGEVPDTIEDLLTLPGVGRKTANLVVSVAYHKPAICVDIHVHRISNRLGYIKTKTPDESEMVLRKKLPKHHWMTYNDILVPFGQFVCTPVSPHCGRCVIHSYCRQVGVTKHR